jgi:hypothetical protein
MALKHHIMACQINPAALFVNEDVEKNWGKCPRIACHCFAIKYLPKIGLA